jgi:hypothetical protein
MARRVEDTNNMQTLVQALQAHQIDVREHESMREHTTWKIGGPADYYIAVADDSQLQVALRELAARDIPWGAVRTRLSKTKVFVVL